MYLSNNLFGWPSLIDCAHKQKITPALDSDHSSEISLKINKSYYVNSTCKGTCFLPWYMSKWEVVRTIFSHYLVWLLTIVYFYTAFSSQKLSCRLWFGSCCVLVPHHNFLCTFSCIFATANRICFVIQKSHYDSKITHSLSMYRRIMSITVFTLLQLFPFSLWIT